MRQRTSQKVIRVLLVVVPLSLLLLGTCSFLVGRGVWNRHFVRYKHIVDLTTTDGKMYQGEATFRNWRDGGAVYLELPGENSRRQLQLLEGKARSYKMVIENADGSRTSEGPRNSPNSSLLYLGVDCFPRSEQTVRAVIEFKEPVPNLNFSLEYRDPMDLP